MNTDLTSAQQRAIASDAPTILTIAGPGSGKTKTMIARIERVIQEDTNPSSVACITFTNAAADEIKSRLANRGVATPGYCGTLHGFLLRALERNTGRRLTVLDEEQETRLLESLIEELKYKGTIKEVKEEIAKGPQKRNVGTSLSVAALVAASFFKRLSSGDMLTFDLILFRGRSLVAEHPEEFDRFTHLFVDEFQDSAAIDKEIYDALPMPSKFFVGDSDQSIYAWRGACVANIVEMAYDSRVEVVYLDDNHRSGSAICTVAQTLIEKNSVRAAKVTRSATGTTGKVTVNPFDTEAEERQWLTRTILNHTSGSVAVLLRTNHLVTKFSEWLTGAGIKVATKKRHELPWDWKAAKLLLSLLNEPQNDQIGFWYMEATIGSSDACKARLNANAEGRSLNDIHFNFPTDLSLPDALQTMARLGISQESISLLQKVEGETISEVLVGLSEVEHHDDETGDGVAVTTFHAAKGREWGVVFLPAFEQQTIPGPKSRDLEEERRVAYVGMTRARDRLEISYAQSRTPQFGRSTPVVCTPSQFIGEAGL